MELSRSRSHSLLSPSCLRRARNRHLFWSERTRRSTRLPRAESGMNSVQLFRSACRFLLLEAGIFRLHRRKTPQNHNGRNDTGLMQLPD